MNIALQTFHIFTTGFLSQQSSLVPALTAAFIIAFITVFIIIYRLYIKNIIIQTEKTERTKAETLLQELQERYRVLTENAPYATVISSLPDGVILYINPQAAELFEVNRDYALGKHTGDFYENSEDRAKVISIVRRHGFLENYESRFKTAGGKSFWASLSARIINYEGKPAFFSGLTDITEKKQAEEALMESEERFRQIFENMEEVLLWSGDYFQMQYVSPAYEKVWGRRRQSLSDDPVAFVEAIYEEDKQSVLEAFERHAQGEPFDVEYRITQPDGEIRWVWDRSFSVKDQEGRIIRQTGIAVDITERKKMEMELEASRKAAEAASIAKSRFLANMSHEIRTPFSGVLGIIDLLMQTDMTEEQSEYVTLLKLSADSLVNIINDILDISRIEAGSMELFSEDFEIHELINSVIRLFEPVLKKKGVSVSSGISPEVPRFLNGDSDKIKQILVNLLNNAVKFTDEGRIEVEVDALSPDDNIVTLDFSVKDTGIGIPAEKLKGIFEPFTQVDNTIQRKYGGTGLGLSICKKLVELMGGNIKINSQVGRGTDVQFSIQLEKAKSAGKYAEQPPGKAYALVEAPQKKIHVLLVEDNEINQILTGKTLELAGHTYRLALNGKEAVDFFSREIFDLILMDIQMPEMDGYTATGVIRKMEEEKGTHTPIVALTAHAMLGDREKCLEAGMDYYIAKPLYADKLISIINDLFNLKSKTEEKEVAPDTPGEKSIEPEFLFKKVNGDIEFFNKMVQNFKKTAEDLLNQINDALKEKNSEKIKTSAHALKGTLAVFNEYKGKRIAQEIEKMGTNKNFTNAETAVAELKKEITGITETLEKFIKQKQ